MEKSRLPLAAEVDAVLVSDKVRRKNDKSIMIHASKILNPRAAVALDLLLRTGPNMALYTGKTDANGHCITRSIGAEQTVRECIRAAQEFFDQSDEKGWIIDVCDTKDLLEPND